MRIFSVLPSGDLARALAEEVGDPALEVAHPCLARVFADDRA
jgi:hypothetical protein